MNLELLLIQGVLPILATLITTLITILLRYLVDYVAEKYKNEKINQAMTIFKDTVYDVVMSLEQTVVSEIIKKSEDGKLTPEEKEEIKNLALEKIKSNVKPHIKATLQMVYNDLDRYLDDVLESKVKEVKYLYPRK